MRLVLAKHKITTQKLPQKHVL